MIIKYDITGSDRKRLVETLSKITLWGAVYEKAPTFAYKVGNYTVDKTGAILCPPTTAKVIIEQLVNLLKEEGFTPKSIEDDALTITIPKETLPPEALFRLRQIISNKATLFERAFQTSVISLEETDDKIGFPWFKLHGLEDEAKAYTNFVFALCNMANEKKHIISKPYDSDNDKFSMRLFLVQLGLKGDKYKSTRKILLMNLSGNSAWRNGVPKEKQKVCFTEEINDCISS